jgi:ubiquinone/menaquinone biosynthesis C-methylase UbiE
LLDVLEHVEHDYLALAEARRVLRPGGVLVVTVPAHPWLWSSHDRFLHHYRRYRGEDLRARLEEAGFSTEQMSHLYMTLFPVVACVRLWEHSAERERSYMGPATGVLPDLLSWICNMEARLVRRGGCLPFGSSLLAVCRRPA